MFTIYINMAEMKTDSREGSIMELREVNRMMYLRPDNGSLVDKRTHKDYNFSNLTYKAGANAQAIIQSGADGVWGPSSFLKFDIKLTGNAADTYTIKNGTLGTNLIESARLTHRSGEIIEFIDKYNNLANVLLNWDNDSSEFTKLESQLNSGSTVAAADQVVTKTWTIPAGSTEKVVSVVVPLWMIFGCFDNKEQYIPPNFLAGAKMELKLASLATVFVSVAANDPSLEVSPSVVLDSAKVYDSVAAQILDQQADVERSGLQFTYSTWFNNSTTSSVSQVNVDIQQSASITEKVIAIFRDDDAVTSPATKDSFAGLPIAQNYQWRLGSQYYPQARVSLAGGQGEAYQHSLIAWNSAPNQYLGFKSDGNCSVDLRRFSLLANDVAPHYATTLEKSAVGLTLTGEPTNNSRSLNFSAGLPALGDENIPAKIDVQIYLKYCRIANIMGENLVVDR